MNLKLILDSSKIFFAQIASRILSFFYILKLADYIGVTDFGYLNFVLAILVVMDAVADIGLGRFLLRQSSLSLQTGSAQVGALLPLRLLTAALAHLAVVAGFWAFGFPPLAVQLAAIVSLGLYFTGVASLLEAMVQSQSRFTYVSLAHILLTLVQVGSGLLVMAAGGSVLALSATFVLTNLVYAAVIGVGAMRLGVRPRFRLDLGLWRSVVPQAFPYAVIFGLFIVSSRVETLAVGWFDAGVGLGLFSVAARMMDASLVAPLALGSVLAPTLIRLHDAAPGELAAVYSRALRITLLLSALGMLLAVELAVPVLDLLLSRKYAGVESIVPLLFAGYPFAAVFYLNAALLLGAQRQRRTMQLIAALLAVQTLVAVSLTASFGVHGAAAAFSLSMAVAGIASTVFVRRWYAAEAQILRAAVPTAAALGSVALVAFGDAGALDPWVGAAALAAYGAVALLASLAVPLRKSG